MKSNALQFSLSKPYYKTRLVDWYQVWANVETWMQKSLKKSGYTKYPDWKEQKLFIERQVRKQLDAK